VETCTVNTAGSGGDKSLPSGGGSLEHYWQPRSKEEKDTADEVA